MTDQYSEKADSTISPLEAAKELALRFKDAFLYFSYNDVGLKYQRWYQKPFQLWAVQNGFIFIPHTHTPGIRGSQAARFYPFRLDENGNQILASLPVEKEL